MTEYKQLKALLSQWGVPFKEFTERQFLYAHARYKQAVAISILHTVDFNFDEKGKFIGSNTQQARSWKSRSK